MRWFVLLSLLFWIAPAYAQDDDEEDESSIEIESEEPDEAEPEKPASKPVKPDSRPRGKGEWIRIGNADSHVSIELPDNWLVSDLRNGKDGWSCQIGLPGPGKEIAMLDVQLLERPEDPRGLPGVVLASGEGTESVSDVRIASRLLPHAIYVQRKGDDTGTVIQAFPLHRGRTMAITLAVAIPMFDSVYETILKAALTAATDLPPWPEVPADYATSTKRGLTYAVHPSVTGSIRHFQDVSQATQKNFEKFHGKLPRIARDSPPPVIFIHSSSDQAAAISPDLKGDTRPFLSETTTMRFFATPIQEDDAKGSHDLASAFGQFLIQRRYGTTIPRWVMVGEINVAGVEHDTGKRLPWIAPGHVAWASGIELPRLDKYQPGNEETVPQVCFFYVAFFHAGGSKYKKAYRAFLDDIATHYDADAAAKRHLEPLGYDKIQAAANKFMRDGFKVTKG